MQSADYSRNAELLSRVREGDREAEAELLEINTGLIRSIALRFRERAAQTHGCEFEDLMQLGSIGMIKAIKSYDPSYGTAFSTYAVPLIIGEIKRFLRDDGPVKVSRTAKRLGVTLMSTREEFRRQNGREPTVDELSQLCNASREDICGAIISMKPVHSFSDTVGEDGTELGELIPSDDDRIEGACDRIALREAVNSLPSLWREIVVLRYFRDMSQQKTAELLGLTQVKVSREEKKIFAKLKSML